MRMINCPNDVLVDLCHDDFWYEAVKQSNHVRIPGRNPMDLKKYVKDQPENEWEILDRDGVNIHDNSAFVEEAYESPSIMLQHPNDFYVYESTRANRKDVTAKNYGVLVSSESSGNRKCLWRHWHKDLFAGQSFSWEDFFEKFHTGAIFPSNSLIFIDRYLFSYDTTFKTDYRNGLNNIRVILKELLPRNFSGEYHVLFIFDDIAISRKATLLDIVNGLQKIKKDIIKELCLTYFLVFEVLTINNARNDNIIYPETHDRQIISNYFTVYATHGFAAAVDDKCSSSNAKWSQKIVFEGLFTGIDNEDQPKDSLPIKNMNYMVDVLKNFISDLSGNHNNGFHYYCNGNSHVDISDLKNRLIKE